MHLFLYGSFLCLECLCLSPQTNPEGRPCQCGSQSKGTNSSVIVLWSFSLYKALHRFTPFPCQKKKKKIPKTFNSMQWIEIDSTLLYSYICGFGLQLRYWVQISFHVGGQSPLSIYLKITLLLITAKIDTVRLSKIWFTKHPSARSDTLILLCSAL